MRKLLKRQGGFTLIELMIVVAIIGILAAIAIPNFLRFQLRSKTSEARTNLAGIRTAEESYFAEYGQYVAQATGTPAGGGGNTKTTWASGTGFDTMGWSPE
ncbi:MAG: prepilin-type N-terminal cleavage/methylation domain-containing protein, partial [Planctomycetota bacterium]|nr:prepilin-type N-terminal cleavage/methylation domain-containing protein [Planctomycetota bacterium]